MDKKEFLDALKKELDERNPVNKDAIYAKYEKRFDLAVEAGFTPEEAAAKFGDPKDIVSKEMAVKAEEGKTPDTFNMNLDVCSDSLTLAYSDDLLEPRVDFNGANPDNYQIDKGTDYFNLRYTNRVTGFFKGRTGGNIVVTVPSFLKFESVRFSSIAGAVHVKKMEAQDIRFNTINGHLDLGSIKGDKVRLQSTAGSMDVEELISADVVFDTVSGKLNIGMADIKDLHLSSVTGSINVKSGHVTSAHTSALSGKITMAS